MPRRATCLAGTVLPVPPKPARQRPAPTFRFSCICGLQVIPEAEETSRLAVMDLDWDHVSAEDILAILRSFLQRGQAIQRVAVYPSDYGTKVGVHGH